MFEKVKLSKFTASLKNFPLKIGNVNDFFWNFFHKNRNSLKFPLYFANFILDTGWGALI